MISKNLKIGDKFTIFIFATLPIAIIIGNFFINFYLFSIFVLFLVHIFKNQDFKWLKDKNFKLLLFLYIYICLNSFLNYFINPLFGFDGIIRSLLFLKFLVLFPAIPRLIENEQKLVKIFRFWLLIIIIIIIDIFIEKYSGSNLFGFKSIGERITSFFYDENVVGTFLFSFGFITIAFFLKDKLNNKSKLILNLLIILILLSILITGERSAFLKSILLFFFIFLFIDQKKIFIKKLHMVLLTLTLIISSIMLFPNVMSKQTEFFKRILIVKNPTSFFQRFENIKYLAHYDVALEIFKDHKLNGIGNKNFRFQCSNEKYFKENYKLTTQRCSTHPHQIHFELLSEQGLIGYLILFFFLFSFFRKKLLNDLKEKNIFKISINFYLLIFLIPVLPGGSLFATFNGLLFWFFLGLGNIKK